MKKSILLLSILILTHLSFAQQIVSQDARMQWWKEAKFGLFLHWGLYAVTAGDWKGHKATGNEHFMLYERIPIAEYGQIAGHFNPSQFNAKRWVKNARNAGMKYIVITAKHHDGFAMFNSGSSDYNVVKMTPFARDPMKELAAACKKYNIKLCFYYSLGRDWEDPDVPTKWPTKGGRSNTWDYPNEDAKDFSKYFERKVKPQINELLTQYGPIAVMWFDTPELISRAQSVELKALIRKLQPKCIINSRIGNELGDYEVSEQKLTTDKNFTPWEACVTMNSSWGYNRYDTLWKSPEVLVRQLVEVVARGGNWLLNIGPTSSGEFPEKSIANLSAIGQWMRINHEAIYGVHSWDVINEGALAPVGGKDDQTKSTMKDHQNDATSQDLHPDIFFTAKNNQVYIFARSWKASELKVAALVKDKYLIKKVELLGSPDQLVWMQEKSGLTIVMPKRRPKAIPVYVFAVTTR